MFQLTISLCVAGEDPEHVMSSRFDRRLEEAGLLKNTDGGSSPPSRSPTPFSSTEDLMNNQEDPGYAKLSILTPPATKSDLKVVDEQEDEEEGYACPADAIKKMRALPPPPLPPSQEEEEEEEDAYATPADAVKRKVSPKLQQIHHQHHRFPNSCSPPPPLSPMVAGSPPNSKRHVMSGYESVDDIRKMREKQRKVKEEKAPLERVASNGSAGSAKGVPTVTTNYEDEKEEIYSQPFDALKGGRVRMASDATGMKPTTTPWQRTNSNGKKGMEPSARFLHHINSTTSVKSLPESTTEPSEPPEVPAHKRSASSSAKVMFMPRKQSPTRLKSPSSGSPGSLPGVGGGGGRSPTDKSPTSPKPIIGGGKRSPTNTAKSPSGSGSKPPLALGRQRSHTEVGTPVSSRTGNPTDESHSSTTQSSRVDRYILEVENSGESRAETGRTRSIDSTLIPAKVTKLRNGRDCITVVSGKPKFPVPPKTGKV